MSFRYENKQGEILITGYEGPVSHLQVPESIDGLPVTGIARSAFSRRNDILYVRLPGSVKMLGMFAFYSCLNLKKAVLHDGITDYYDGVFRGCSAVSEYEVHINAGRFVILKDLLAESDRTMRFTICLPDGQVRLVFPDYLFEYHEDTFARAFHSSFEGAGYTYRECVGKTGIDFAGYDSLFGWMASIDTRLAAEIAMERLAAPYQLSAKAAPVYREFLNSNSVTAAVMAAEGRRKDWAGVLLQDGLLSAAAADAAIRCAGERKDAEMVSMLMNGTAKPAAAGRFEL